jgi:hypothetical protein
MALNCGGGFTNKKSTLSESSESLWRTSHAIEEMARSVTISTPVPTLEEFGKSLGLSKSRRDSLLRLVRRDSKWLALALEDAFPGETFVTLRDLARRKFLSRNSPSETLRRSFKPSQQLR